MDSNKIIFGLSNVHYAVATISTDSTSGEQTITYGTPVAIPGAVKMTLSPQGEDFKFYADNDIYYASSSNDGYSGSLDFAKIPEGLLTAAMGQKSPTNGGIVESTDDSLREKYIAFMYQVEGDANARKVLLPWVKLSRGNADAETKGEKMSNTNEGLNFNAYGRPTDKMVRWAVNDSSATVYANFFNSVPSPTYSST